eukprot:TRINITY_DN65704_c0_g1_i1.p1 TRINITY_DN65704_c0_g1~~TRINITY_DN65704_c0_g1_i1.p1  ORF type:complete len:326 (+),score=89.23 TRINITY_DN65704_c0_g1_i1:52-1029(+)
MFNAMNQSKQDLQLGLQRATAAFEARFAQLEAAKNRELQTLRQRAELALREADERHRLEMQRLVKELEAERASRNAERYHIESLQENLRHLRAEADAGRSTEVTRLRENSRHVRDQLAACEAELRAVRRELDEALATQHHLREKLRKADSRARDAHQPLDFQGGLGHHMQAQSPSLSPHQMQQGPYPSQAPAPQLPQGTMDQMPAWGASGAAQGFGQFETQDAKGWFAKENEADNFEKDRKRKTKEKKASRQKQQNWDPEPSSPMPSVEPTFSLGDPPPQAAGPTGNEEAIETLKAMGFGEERIRTVLDAVGGSIEKAVPVLLAD